MCFGFFFFKQKTAYEMRISDWSSDVCSSDLTCRKALQSQEARTQCQPARLLFADRRRDRRHRRDRAFVLDRQHDRESRWNAALYAARTRREEHLHAGGLLQLPQPEDPSVQRRSRNLWTLQTGREKQG